MRARVLGLRGRLPCAAAVGGAVVVGAEATTRRGVCVVLLLLLLALVTAELEAMDAYTDAVLGRGAGAAGAGLVPRIVTSGSVS